MHHVVSDIYCCFILNLFYLCIYFCCRRYLCEKGHVIWIKKESPGIIYLILLRKIFLLTKECHLFCIFIFTFFTFLFEKIEEKSLYLTHEYPALIILNKCHWYRIVWLTLDFKGKIEYDILRSNLYLFRSTFISSYLLSSSLFFTKYPTFIFIFLH
jgi:hypothetical protein